MVAICDHLGFLALGDLEHEVAREALLVSLDLLVETLGGNAIQARKIRVQDNAQASNEQDSPLNSFCGNDGFFRGHVDSHEAIERSTSQPRRMFSSAVA